MAASAQQIETKIRGFREAKAAFQALPTVMRERLLVATETTLSEIVRHAKGRIQSNPSIRTRALLNAIHYTINKNNGRGRAGVSNGTTSITIGGRKFRIRGQLRLGRNGSALTSEGAALIRPSRYAHLVEYGRGPGGTPGPSGRGTSGAARSASAPGPWPPRARPW